MLIASLLFSIIAMKTNIGLISILYYNFFITAIVLVISIKKKSIKIKNINIFEIFAAITFIPAFIIFPKDAIIIALFLRATQISIIMKIQ